MNTIVIPHRDRHAALARCVCSILWSALECGPPWTDPRAWEILVIDNGSGREPYPYDYLVGSGRVRVVHDEREMPVFNKAALLNVGIDCGGDVLTFLDADAIVGPRWIRAVEALDDPAVTLLAYRVRYLPPGTDLPDRDSWRALFDPAEYERHPRAYEAYGRAEYNPKVAPADPASIATVLGNSQFSLRRDMLRALGNLRWDEAFVGRGWEDLDMLRRIRRAAGDAYRGAIRTDPASCLYHVRHDYRPDWRTPDAERANRRRFFEGADPHPNPSPLRERAGRGC
ncbi:MAG TPA: glycosyltransferase [Phycisphaerae bacterium]|nr:glycosyltransferase [Phycisphaerae bacterium]